jgi:hypothetical protein
LQLTFHSANKIAPQPLVVATFGLIFVSTQCKSGGGWYPAARNALPATAL